MTIKNLSLLFCLMTTSASAAVIVKGVDALLPQDQDKVFSILIKPKHDLERIDQINADIAAALPTKRFLTAYWVPDTLYQVTQSYFDIQRLSNHGDIYAKQARIQPKHWKKAKRMAESLNRASAKPRWFLDFLKNYPTTLQEHKALSPTVVTYWARFNNIAHNQLALANFQTRGSQHALSKIFETGPQYQRRNERRSSLLKNLTVHTSHLKANEAFLKHALTAEEQAHREGKLLLWRYTQPLAGNIPDLPFNIHAAGLEHTIRSPLEYFEMHVNMARISYAGRLLEGFFGDGAINEMPYNRWGAPACTFSFLANDTAVKKKGIMIPNPIIYSLALSPEKIKELKDKRYFYYPREAMPQHIGIYGTGEGFHPGWLLKSKCKEKNKEKRRDNVKAWLELMQSDALQVHLMKGVLHADFKNNPETQRLRAIYSQFLRKASTEPILAPKDPPVVPHKPKPAPVKQPAVTKPMAPVKKPVAPVAKPVPVKKPVAPTAKLTPVKKPVAPVAKPIPLKQPLAPTAKPIPLKQPVAPAAKPVPVKKPVAPVAKLTPVKKPVAPVAKPAPVKKPVAPVAKLTPVKKPVAPVAKPAPVKKPVAPVAKPAPVKKPVAPVAKPLLVKKPVVRSGK